MRPGLSWLLLVLLGCSGIDNPLIGGDGGGMGGGSTATGGGSGGSGGSTGGGSTSTGGGAAGCVESWACQPWVIAGTQATRACVDVNGCGTTASQPPLTGTPPALDLEAFKCNVQPIFQKSCASLGCHGQQTGRPLRIYARGRLRHTEMVVRSICQPTITTPYDLGSCTGSCDCDCKRPHTTAEWQLDYDSARAFMIGLTNPDQSELLTQPLTGSAFAHAGRKFFTSATDPRYVAIRNWLQGQALGSACSTGAN